LVYFHNKCDYCTASKQNLYQVGDEVVWLASKCLEVAYISLAISSFVIRQEETSKVYIVSATRLRATSWLLLVILFTLVNSYHNAPIFLPQLSYQAYSGQKAHTNSIGLTRIYQK
jgi:hypothetical protein